MPVPHVDVFGLTKHRFPSNNVFLFGFSGKFEDHTVQTGSRRFVIRNLRLSNYLIRVSVFSQSFVPTCHRDLLFCALGWCDGVFKNRPNLDFAPFPGRFRRSKLLRDLPSRAARPWVGGGCSTWCEALSSGELVGENGGQNE